MAASATPSLLYVTDFSDSSMSALEWAITEALRHNLHISVLYPYRLDQVKKKENGIQSKKELELEAAEKFGRLAEGVLQKNQVSFDFKAEIGFLRDRISEHAKRHNDVLLVIGKKLASAESFAELVEETSMPVVIVPPKRR